MKNIKQHLDWLGFKVKDKTTGFTGVVTSISFDLYGCIQAIVNPAMTKEGKLQDAHYFDVSRLQKIGKSRVMELPNYDFGVIAEGKQGAAEKPDLLSH